MGKMIRIMWLYLQVTHDCRQSEYYNIQSYYASFSQSAGSHKEIWFMGQKQMTKCERQNKTRFLFWLWKLSTEEL